MTHTHTTITLTADIDADYEPISPPKHVLDLSPADWALIHYALMSVDTGRREHREYRLLAKDIETEILAHLPEEVA